MEKNIVEDTVDNIQLRVYRDEWGVTLRVPTYGDLPITESFAIDPTPSTDTIRTGNYVTTVEWGAGPGGAPVIIISKA